MKHATRIFVRLEIAAALAIVAVNTASAQVDASRFFTPPKGFWASANFEHRQFYRLDDVLGDSDVVMSHSAKSGANGFGGSFGFSLPNRPAFTGEFGGYWATGPETKATLTNGRVSIGDMIDYGIALGIGLNQFYEEKLEPHANIKAVYEWNRLHYKEYTAANALVFSETRMHGTWTGEYQVGATYWALPQVGWDASLSYSGMFKKKNADENFK